MGLFCPIAAFVYLKYVHSLLLDIGQASPPKNSDQAIDEGDGGDGPLTGTTVSMGMSPMALRNLYHTLDEHNPDFTEEFYFRLPLEKEDDKSISEGKDRGNSDEGENGKRYSSGRGGNSVFGELNFTGEDVYRENVVSEYWRLLSEMRELGGEDEKKYAWLLGGRVKEFERCGDKVVVRTCECCGEDRAGSGSFAGSTRTCTWRACPYCGWVRAQKIGEFYEKVGENVDIPDGYVWQKLTVTTRYAPWSHDDVTWQALRHRARLVLKAVKKLWEKKLKVTGGGMFRSIECSARAHVHGHLLYLGPPVDSKELTDFVQKEVSRELGYIYAEDLKPGDQDETGNWLPTALKNVSKYMAKGACNFSSDDKEEWFAGMGNAECIDPRLAARWEIAVYKMRLMDRYGALRGLDFSESDYSYEPPDDSKTACSHCGTVGKWKSSYRTAYLWIQDMHEAGKQALEGSGWQPWWRRKQFERWNEGVFET